MDFGETIIFLNPSYGEPTFQITVTKLNESYILRIKYILYMKLSSIYSANDTDSPLYL